MEYYQAWASRVDFNKKEVLVEEAVSGGRAAGKGKGREFRVKYDKLVIAVGCYAQTFGVKGVAENAYFLKDVSDARNIRKRVLSCFEAASLPTTSEDRRKELLHFAIVGGGRTFPRTPPAFRILEP